MTLTPEEEAAATELGMIMPSGTDEIADGDDAITTNAGKAALNIKDLQAAVSPVKSALRLRSLDDLPSLVVDDWVGTDLIGIYPMPSETTVETIVGRPHDAADYAWITITPIASGGSLVQWVEYRGQRRTWERIVSSTASNRTAWRRTDQAYRTVLHNLTMPGNSTLVDTVRDRDVRLPVKFFRRIDTWELVLKNFNDRTSTNFGSLDFVNVYIGKRAKVDGEYTADFDGTPFNLGTPVLTGSGDTARYQIAHIEWPLEANTEYILAYGYTTADDTDNHLGIGGSYNGTNPGAVAAASSPNVWEQYTPLDVYIKPDVPAEVPFYVYPGSSSETGLHSDYPLRDCWSWRHAAAHGAIPAQLGQSGTTMLSWIGASNYIRHKLSTSARADKIIGNPASNDVYGGADLATLQARFLDFAAWAQTHLGEVFEAADVFPRASETTTIRDDRLAFNEWLRTMPGGILRCHDRSSPVSGPDGLLRPDFDSGDGTHLNTAGQHALAAAVISSQPRPDTVQRYSVTEDAGRKVTVWDGTRNREQLIYYDTGIRNVRNLWAETSTTGRVEVVREGWTVTLIINGAPREPGMNTQITLPEGWRPPASVVFADGFYDGTDGPSERVIVGSNGSVQFVGADGSTIDATLSWRTNEPPQPTLPGTDVGVIPAG